MTYSWEVIRGNPQPPEQPALLETGRLRAGLQRGDVFAVEGQDVELLRLVGIRVRGARWETIPPDIETAQIEPTARGMSARVRAGYRSADLEFSASIKVELEDGRLVYELDGVAEREFAYARIGIVVLHPPAITAGRPFRAWRPGGAPTEGVLPELVGAQLIASGEIKPLFAAFQRLDVQAAPGLELSLEFEGDDFEMEDQRNWTDGSFKTYSTRVGLPVPHHAFAGARFHQRLKFQVRESRRRPRGASSHEPVITFGERTGDAVMPPLGTTWRPIDRSAPALAGALRTLRPAHLRVECRQEADLRSRLQLAHSAADAIGADLEVALHLPNGTRETEAVLGAAAAAITELGSPRLCVAVTRDGEPVTSARTGERVRAHLKEVAVLGGSAMNFAELNRDPPTAQAPFDGVVFAANPQVHDSDDRSIMQSPSGLRAAALTARNLPGRRPVHVSPITLLPRNATTADARQSALFTAAWLTAAVHALCAAGAASASWFELAGPAGLTSGDGSRLYPAFHVLRELCAWRGRRTAALASSAPEAFASLGSEDRDGLTALVANLTVAQAVVRIVGIRGEVTVGSLDTTSAAEAEPFAASESRVRGPELRLELGPYAVVRLRGSVVVAA